MILTQLRQIASVAGKATWEEYLGKLHEIATAAEKFWIKSPLLDKKG